MPPSWDERYAPQTFFYGTQANDFLAEHAGRIADRGATLSLGEGEGRNAVFLASRGLQVLALDQSPIGLAKAERLAAARGVSIRTLAVDLADYQVDAGIWDAIVSIWCHLPSALRRRVYAEIVAGLRPGGVLLLESYTPDQIGMGTGGPKDPDLMPTLEDLRSELAGLDFEVALEQVREVREGTGHQGPSAVVQILARRPG